MTSPGSAHSIHSSSTSQHHHHHHHQIEIPPNSAHSTHSTHSNHSATHPAELVSSPGSTRDREPYSDHSPSRHRTIHSNTQNQLDQDVQAALHFSRARAGTLDLPISNPPSSYQHHQKLPASDQLLWSNRDLLRGVTPDPSTQFAQISSTPPALQNPQAHHLLHHHHQQQQPLESPHNQFHHLHRSLSDHSFDSSHGAFIDHRPSHMQPSPIARSSLHPINPSADHHPSDSNLPTSHPQLTPLFQSPCNLIDDSLPPSLSAQVSTESHHFLPNPNLRPQLNQEEIRDSLAFLAQDPSNRNQIRNRKPSHPGIQVPDPKNTQNFNIQIPDHDGSCAATSPRPSQAEEDVCFPSLEADRPLSKDQQQPIRLDDQKLIAMGHERGTAGMLPHFPFPFNFQALEEFAQTERETLNLMRNRQILRDPYRNSSQTPGLHDRTLNRTNNAEDGVPFTDEEENLGEEDFSAVKDSAMRRRKIGFLTPSVDKTDESGISDRRTVSGGAVGSSLGGRMGGILNQRRMSENVRPISSAQRKLALFEGAGHNLLNGFSFGSNEAGSGISGPGGSLKANGGANQFESRAPLLGSRLNRFPFGGGGGGDGGGTKHHQVRWMNNNERPYRFSFYSNALPSTIHARSLAEIPGEGQTFEDLFVGRSNGTPSTGKTTEQDPPEAAIHQHNAPKDMFSSSQNQDLSKNHSSSINDLLHIPPVAKNLNSPSGTDKFDSNDLLSDAQMASMGEPLKRTSPIPHHQQQQQQQQQESYANNNRKQRTGVLMRTDEDAEANTWWLDVLSPTDQEMKLLSKVFGIHPLTTEDILMEETREKIELFRNYYLVCFRSFDQDPYSPTYLEPLNIYIIVFREGTLSFHFRAVSHPQNVRRRIKQLKDYINVTSDWISYALIDDITDAFGPLIQSIEYEVDSIDELVLILKDVEQSDMLRRIGTCRKKVMGLLRLMGNKADVVKGLAKRCNENWLVAPKSDIGLYLSDIQDHLVTMTQNLNHYEKILSRSHSNYLAQISIEMTDANNQINDVLSKLTALGSILVPMNLVTGLWGMNVHVPGQDVTEGYAWFIAIVCALVSFGIIGAWLTLRYFKFSNR